MPDIVAVHSGGLDSTVLLYHLRADGHTVRALAVDYGQRHRDREFTAGEATCRHLGIERRILDLTSLTKFLGTNRLTNPDSALPVGPYSAQSMALTLVPNRNMILLAAALAWAIDCGAVAVAYGAHSGEYTPYPDCTPGFAMAMDAAARVCHTSELAVWAPFVGWSKADIVKRGAELGVPFDSTWSCYRGDANHCGECGTCRDRREAFRAAKVPDPTVYLTGIALS